MFARVKRSGNRQYLQLVENHWQDGQSRQRVIATLGRLDNLQATGQVDAAIKSLARFAVKAKIIEDHKHHRLAVHSVKRIGPDLVLARLWERLGLPDLLNRLLAGRQYGFAVERAIYFTVLSRLFFPGSDRRALRLARDYRIGGSTELKLHQLYRAMAWLGEVKDEIEERLFARNRDLFTGLDLVFFDTTSLYFEGQGGKTLGRCGYSKDGRPGKHQMIVGAVLDHDGRPISCPMWPGNMADVKTLCPVVERLRDRFGVKDIVVVADRGMISQATLKWLAENKIGYILGVRLRRVKEVRLEVLTAPGAYQTVRADLQVKEVVVAGKRYIVCFNPEEAERDRLARASIVESLRKKPTPRPRSAASIHGYRRYLKIDKSGVTIDEAKIQGDELFDGKYVLQTNTELAIEQVALKYKELWQVERVFREVKSVLETRPVYHKYDMTIQGHVFCSFLALVAMKELVRQVGDKPSWDEIRQDLDALYETEVEQDGVRHILNGPYQGMSRKILKAVGIAAPPSFTAPRT
jgi:hypothetical protein